ncbi:hypothetical protein [Virgibacillus halodenitrificans]|nr:hypothetical protein [Virgibacillus halodenitrificans]
MAFGWCFCPLERRYWTVVGIWMVLLSIRDDLMDTFWRLDEGFVH